MTADIDRRAEWRQIFNDQWRLYRDFFYDQNMHRIDWPLMRQRYARMLDACMTREDVHFVLSEMAGELSVGHAYGSGGDFEEQPRVPIGMLGADFELHNGAYRITKNLRRRFMGYQRSRTFEPAGIKVRRATTYSP